MTQSEMQFVLPCWPDVCVIGLQMAAYGSDMQSVGFTEAWLMSAGKQLIWQRFLQAKLRKKPKGLQASSIDDDKDGAQLDQVHHYVTGCSTWFWQA